MTTTETSLPQVSRVAGRTNESSKVCTLVLDRHLEAKPGQFVMAWLPGLDEKPFSLVGSAPVTLTVAQVGPFSTAIHGLEIGDRLWLRGPLGQPFTLPGTASPKAESLLFMGGGYGVAPLHYLAEHAQAVGWPVHMIIGARTAEDVVFANRFAALGAGVTITTDDGSLGQRGVVTDAAEALLDKRGFAALYACGPEPMLDAVERLARARQLPAQLSYERYMRCGFGVCGSCAREGWLVCRDGPVRELNWIS
jgi:dihydroorotate dehydrogenase electron transfer subunit